jgi:hypothetical protein
MIPRPGCLDATTYECMSCELLICADCNPSPGEPDICGDCYWKEDQA